MIMPCISFIYSAVYLLKRSHLVVSFCHSSVIPFYLDFQSKYYTIFVSNLLEFLVLCPCKIFYFIFLKLRALLEIGHGNFTILMCICLFQVFVFIFQCEEIPFSLHSAPYNMTAIVGDQFLS